mmetsp:Transcript_32786/g.55492  ORF Transcript_32786/g.55492 Transcript_32786/m.55492 type:complete len:470 (-) Transcript_32786:1446-2855(-)
MAKTKTGGKKKGVLAKPKRPMSAYNFFFREERANILSESTKKTEEGEAAEPTSFEDIGRIIGQRWRAIDPDELAKYKEMAKKDSDRYRDEMKSFYNDELTLMCLGHNNEGAAAAGGNPDQVNVNGQPQDAPSAAGAGAHQNGGRMMSESQQMSNLLQQQQQQQQQAMMNDLALRQDLMVMLAQERARAGPAGMNPYQAQLPPMNVGSNSFDPMGSAGSMGSNNIMNEDQILQLLMLQQQQGATANGQPAPPNEAFLKIVLSQKNVINERLDKISNEAKTLQIKRAIMDKIVSKEFGPGAQSEESRSSASGLDADNLSVEELFQLLQQQAAHTAASGLGVSNSPAVGGTPQPPAGNPMGGGGGGPSMQEILLRQQQAANQPPPQMNNIHPSYFAQIMAAQAPPQQHQQMFDLNGMPQGMPQGMNGLPQGMGMMPNGGVPGAVPGPGGNGVSAEDMIKKLMAEQNGQGGNR